MSIINIPIFIISLAFGLFFVYINNPKKRIVYVYPSPDNVEKIQYKDKVNNCHKFVPKVVKCPSDVSKITNYDIQ